MSSAKEEEEVKEDTISFHMPLIMYHTCTRIQVVLSRMCFRTEWFCTEYLFALSGFALGGPGCIICNKVTRSFICFVYLLSKGIVYYDFEMYS